VTCRCRSLQGRGHPGIEALRSRRLVAPGSLLGPELHQDRTGMALMTARAGVCAPGHERSPVMRRVEEPNRAMGPPGLHQGEAREATGIEMPHDCKTARAREQLVPIPTTSPPTLASPAMMDSPAIEWPLIERHFELDRIF